MPLPISLPPYDDVHSSKGFIRCLQMCLFRWWWIDIFYCRQGQRGIRSFDCALCTRHFVLHQGVYYAHGCSCYIMVPAYL